MLRLRIGLRSEVFVVEFKVEILRLFVVFLGDDLVCGLVIAFNEVV